MAHCYATDRPGNREKDFGVDRKRWDLVRSHFCTDEFKSVAAEEDSTSIWSSEASVSQPKKDEKDEASCTDEETTPNKRPLNEERAAKLIQSASRAFLEARRPSSQKLGEAERESGKGIILSAEGGQSVGVGVLSDSDLQLQTQPLAHPPPKHQPPPYNPKTHLSKSKEDWDPSTVTSSVSKMRIQHRLEATMKREKALAYAFSLQLRTFTSRKNRMPHVVTGTNFGWGWLEDQLSKHMGPNSGNQGTKSKKLEMTGEEKESCGSNEVSVGLVSVHPDPVMDESKPVSVSRKATKGVSRRKTTPSSQCPSQKTKVSKIDGTSKTEEVKKHKNMLQRGTGKINHSNYLATN